MVWTTDPDHPFAGIAEKLKRADENIVDLHKEILRFFKICKYPVIPTQTLRNGKPPLITIKISPSPNGSAFWLERLFITFVRAWIMSCGISPALNIGVTMRMPLSF